MSFSLRTPITALLVACVATTAAAADATFTRDSYGAASRPRAIVAADFNRDGRIDVATAGAGDASVVVLLNDLGTGGGLRTAQTIPVGGGPFDMATGDLNRDGVPDLVVANADLNAVTILTGRGDGTFNPPLTVAVGGNPRGVALADVTGDGKTDILVTQYASNTWTLLAGDGAGGIASTTTYATAANPQGIAVVDLDHDGLLDAVVVHAGSASVGLFYRAGRPAMTHRTVAVGTPLNVVAAGDLNRDGWIDIVAASTAGSSVSVLLGSAAGLTAAATLPAGSSPRGIVMRDLNQDGRLDVVLANRASSSLTAYFGQRDGSLGGAVTLSAGGGSRAVAAADFDNDGRVDLVSANETDNSTSLFLNSTSFVTAGHVYSQHDYGDDVRSSGGAGSIAIADFDRDGANDIAIDGGPGPRILLASGRKVDLPGYYPTRVRSADVNGDGNVDLLTTEYWTNGVFLYAGDGRGGFAAPVKVAGVPGAQGLAVGDMNRDGRLDFVVSSHDETAGTNSVRVFLGRPDGSFALAVNTAVPWTANGLSIADLDRDGRPDVAFAQYQPAGVRVLYGNGSGGWRASASIPLAGGGLDLAVADVDEDGRLDLVVPVWDRIAIVRGTAGGFATPAYVDVPRETYAYEITAGDVDLDGHVDLLTGNMDVFVGHGDGTFDVSMFDTFGDAPTVADVTGDGVPDLLVSSLDWLTVLVGERNESNRAPVVSAGPDRTMNYSSLVGDTSIDAAGFDPDVHELHYQWRNADGQVVATSPSFYPGLLAPGRYQFTVTAYDGRGASTSDTMVLTVTPYQEINLYPASLAWDVEGAWRVVADATAADGLRLSHPDAGAPKLASPLAAPVNYFDVSFLADPTQTYKLWIRGKAERNSPVNDSVFVQFTGATDTHGTASWEIGTTSALTVNLEECSGCGLSGWGWEDDGWGAVDRNGTLIRFPGGGWHTIRIQTREDGLSIDQIVLSAQKYLTTRPGAAKNDATILPSTAASED